MALKLIREFTFDHKDSFSSVNLLLTKNVTRRLRWIRRYKIAKGFVTISVTKALCSELTQTLHINIGSELIYY